MSSPHLIGQITRRGLNRQEVPPNGGQQAHCGRPLRERILHYVREHHFWGEWCRRPCLFIRLGSPVVRHTLSEAADDMRSSTIASSRPRVMPAY